jgi:serine/threonine protein kinase
MAVRSGVFLEARMWGHMSTTDLPGSDLLAGRYRLVERLGAGGMSVVWRGFDEVLGRQVAVKVLPPSTSADPSFRRRLRAEAQAAARLSHPHITNVYDYGEATTVDGEPVPFVVMELVDGESLAAVLTRARTLPWNTAVRISADVAAALAAAHARGIVHRDVTPANVMLTASGAKVVDFGISALIGENDTDPDGSLLGTPAYLAPERLEGGQVSPATDVYAVGLLIYRMLIGQLPWDVGTTTALLRAHQYTEPEPLPPVEGMPPEVDALIGRCLEKHPADRPPTAEVAHLLAGIAARAPAAELSGFEAEWEDGGENTTILPSGYPYVGMGQSGSGDAVEQAPAPAGRAGRRCSSGPQPQADPVPPGPGRGRHGRAAQPVDVWVEPGRRTDRR